MIVEPAAIRQARQADLPSYLRSRGETLIRDGKGWHLKEHDSLQINGNMYYWNSKGTSGNSLSFVREYYGLSFQDAIKELTGEEVRQASPPVLAQGAREERQAEMPQKADNVRRVYAYLTQTRCISHEVVQACFNKHLLYQDEKGNAVFRMLDRAGQVVGAELNGTGPARFKGIAAGSRFGHGFSFALADSPGKICVFESAVDLLSFMTLYGSKLDRHALVSMEGLKEQTLLTMAKAYNVPLQQVWCCVDNDEAGTAFAQRMATMYGTKTYLPPVKGGVKDWNDLLKQGV